jgi:hypothetical protein
VALQKVDRDTPDDRDEERRAEDPDDPLAQVQVRLGGAAHRHVDLADHALGR